MSAKMIADQKILISDVDSITELLLAMLFEFDLIFLKNQQKLKENRILNE